MARCPECHAPVATETRFCAECGAPLDRRERTLGSLIPQFAGAGVDAPALPIDQSGFSMKQVLIAVGLMALFLLFIIFYVGRPVPPAASGTLPVLGGMNEAVTVGDTVWGVAFTERPAQFANRPARYGQFVVVGVVTGNRGTEQFVLATGAAILQDGNTGKRYRPMFIAWGTPDDFSRGRYAAHYTVPPRGTAAGLLVFDVPTSLAHPRLLVRDMAGAKEFVGGIDLEKQARVREP